MWTITPQGFYSVVAHRDDPDTLLVRARVRADLDALRAQIPSLEIVERPGSDYRYRAFVSRASWVDAVASLARAIDYGNVKDAVTERQGSARAALYLRVWDVLRGLQR